MTDLDMVMSVLRARPGAQDFIRRRYGLQKAALDVLARYIMTYGGKERKWWAALGAPHTTPLESHGAGFSERAAVEDLLDNLHRIPR